MPLACPNCHTPVNDDLTCPADGRVATRTPDGRIAWRVFDDELAAVVEGERIIWDQQEVDRPDWVPGRQPTLTEWMGEPIMRPVAARYPELSDVRGLTVLDVGATCRFGVRFLTAGAKHLHQVEVSPGAQRLGMRQLAAAGFTSDATFHTVPAETLPFADDSFDMVFSSGTIHHTDRARSLPELHRVLKPGGTILLIEAFMSRMIRPALHARRGARHLDRGTDDPLGHRDLALIRELFDDVAWQPFDVAWLFASRFLPDRGPRTSRVHRFDRTLRQWGGLAYVIGTSAWIAGHKL